MKGNRKRTRSMLLVALASSSLLGGACSRGRSELERSAAEAAPVLAAEAARQDVPVTLRAIGTVEAYRSVAVRARVAGTLTGVRFREGQDVRAGEILFSIDSRPYDVALKAAAANLAEGKARAAIAALEARRAADLMARDLVSRQAYESALATAEAESAAAQALDANVESARLNLDYCSITAPISGRASNLLVDEGNLVRANDTQALLVINQMTPIFVSFSVPERRLPDLERALAGERELAVDAAPPGAGGEPARGRLTFVNNEVDPATGTVLLKAEFPNRERTLWPGQFVQVTLTLAMLRGAVVVPAAAVQTSQQGEYVFVIKPDHTADMRAVTSGPRIGDQVVVEKGLAPGETVVTDGHLRVVPGGKVTIKADLESAGAAGSTKTPGGSAAAGSTTR